MTKYYKNQNNEKTVKLRRIMDDNTTQFFSINTNAWNQSKLTPDQLANNQNYQRVNRAVARKTCNRAFTN